MEGSMKLTMIGVWIIFGCFGLFCAFMALLTRWHFRREEKLCLLVLFNTSKTHGMITTEGFAHACGFPTVTARQALERLRRIGLAYGCTDEERWWYWKITDTGRERLMRYHPELRSPLSL